MLKKYVETIEELAEELGRSSNTIYLYKRKGAPIQAGPRGYDVEEVRNWVQTHVRRKINSPLLGEVEATPENLERREQAQNFDALYLKERALKTKAQREREELRHKIESGEYIPLEEVKKRDTARISVVKTGLLTLPRRLAQELTGLTTNQIEVVLKQRFRELLERFSTM